MNVYTCTPPLDGDMTTVKGYVCPLHFILLNGNLDDHQTPPCCTRLIAARCQPDGRFQDHYSTWVHTSHTILTISGLANLRGIVSYPVAKQTDSSLPLFNDGKMLITPQTKIASWYPHIRLVNYTYLMFAVEQFNVCLHFAGIFSCDQAALWMVFSVCLSVCPSVRLSVCPSHLFDYVPIIVSSWNFQELSPRTRVTSMQKVKVRGQRSRSQRSQPNLAVSGL